MRAVLFDFGDTLFRRFDGGAAIVEIGAQRDCPIDFASAKKVWTGIEARSRSPEEMARGRDLSPQAHRREWTRLFSAADVFAPGLGEALYELEIDPRRWQPFADTASCLSTLKQRGVAMGVVSDTGWDIRQVFALHGLEQFIDVWVLSFEHRAVKPAPRLFHRACESLGATPADALMVGDNAIADGGACSAGLATLLLPPVAPGRPRGLVHVERIVGVREP